MHPSAGTVMTPEKIRLGTEVPPKTRAQRSFSRNCTNGQQKLAKTTEADDNPPVWHRATSIGCSALQELHRPADEPLSGTIVGRFGVPIHATPGLCECSQMAHRTWAISLSTGKLRAQAASEWQLDIIAKFSRRCAKRLWLFEVRAGASR